MPTYDVECPSCGRYERTARIAEQHRPCDKCGARVELLITSRGPARGFEPYFDIALGREVTGWGDIHQEMRRQHLDYRDHPSPGETSVRLDKIAEKRRRAAHA